MIFGGFFVLIILIGIAGVTRTTSVLQGIPNDALAAIVFSKESTVREMLAPVTPLLQELASIPNLELAVVVLPPPMTIGVIVHAEHPQTLIDLANATDATIKPLGNRLVAVGSTSFGTRVAESAPIPWWIQFRLFIARKTHDGSFLWTPDINTPFLIGFTDTSNSHVRFTIPTGVDQRLSLNDIESAVRKILPSIASLLFPISSIIMLPDGTTSREIRKNPEYFSWKTENKDESWVLFHGDSPVFSYKKGQAPDNSCYGGTEDGFHIFSAKDAPNPILSIFSLKKVIIFCF